MKQDSLAAIAKISGVSIATVSRVLSGKAEQARISKATRKRFTPRQANSIILQPYWQGACVTTAAK